MMMATTTMTTKKMVEKSSSTPKIHRKQWIKQFFSSMLSNGSWCWNKPQSRFEYEWRRYNWPFSILDCDSRRLILYVYYVFYINHTIRWCNILQSHTPAKRGLNRLNISLVERSLNRWISLWSNGVVDTKN